MFIKVLEASILFGDPELSFSAFMWKKLSLKRNLWLRFSTSWKCRRWALPTLEHAFQIENESFDHIHQSVLIFSNIILGHLMSAWLGSESGINWCLSLLTSNFLLLAIEEDTRRFIVPSKPIFSHWLNTLLDLKILGNLPTLFSLGKISPINLSKHGGKMKN